MWTPAEPQTRPLVWISGDTAARDCDRQGLRTANSFWTPSKGWGDAGRNLGFHGTGEEPLQKHVTD